MASPMKTRTGLPLSAAHSGRPAVRRSRAATTAVREAELSTVATTRGARAELAAGRYLLHGPGVAVRIAEEDEPDVVERVRLGSRVLAHDLNLADVNPSLDEPTRRLKVRDDQLQALERARRH